MSPGILCQKKLQKNILPGSTVQYAFYVVFNVGNRCYLKRDIVRVARCFSRRLERESCHNVGQFLKLSRQGEFGNFSAMSRLLNILITQRFNPIQDVPVSMVGQIISQGLPFLKTSTGTAMGQHTVNPGKMIAKLAILIDQGFEFEDIFLDAAGVAVDKTYRGIELVGDTGRQVADGKPVFPTAPSENGNFSAASWPAAILHWT
jgi:hypothetical protein